PQTTTMAIFKCFLAFAMICAYARGMSLPQSQRSPRRSPSSLSSTYSNQIHSFGSYNSESLEVTPFVRVLRSASPRRGRYHGSHRSAPTTSGYDGSHRSPSAFRGALGSSRYRQRGRRSASPMPRRYDGSHRSAPSRYSGSHRSPPSFWGARA
ncbi:unnamed protein product, partial [Meganyctiphanes norvegica]